MKIFSIIRHHMTPLCALRYLFLARPNGKEPAMSRIPTPSSIGPCAAPRAAR